MKKLFAMMLAAAMMMSLAACGGGNEQPAPAPAPDNTQTEQPAPETPDEPALTTVTEGKLTVATSPDFAPYEFYAIAEDGTATLAGFEMALAQYIADYLGLTLEVVPMDFDSTIMELGNKTVDLGMAGYSPKPEREVYMDFSDIFYTGGQSFVCLNSNKDKFPTLEAANDPQYSIGAQRGSIQLLDLAMVHTPDADIIELPKVPEIVAELVGGKLDGAFIETVVAETYAKNYPELCVALDVPYDQAGSVVGVIKGNEPLLNAVNEAIAEALSSGAMSEFVTTANELAEGNIHEGLLEG